MNVLIIEDESHTASLLEEIIEQNENFKVIEKLESVIDAVSYIRLNQNRIDLMFFDIELADGQSFEIFKHIDIQSPVVFCTAYDDHSLKAFKFNGIDYILKPFKEEEIHAALLKFNRLLRNFNSYENNLDLHFFWK